MHHIILCKTSLIIYPIQWKHTFTQYMHLHTDMNAHTHEYAKQWFKI